MVAKHGAENAPPPWQTFTIANDIQEGNLHFVQKVFEGAFEVSGFLGDKPRILTSSSSLIYSILQRRQRPP